MFRFSSILQIKHICIYAFVIRLVVLTFIMISGDSVSLGLQGSEYTQDDVRYLALANLYEANASSIIDPDALENALDEVEPGGIGVHNPKNLFIVELWYWIVAIGMYILKYEFLLRLFNIILAVYSVKYLYELTCMLYGKKVASIASMLYALLPYPVIFSCFLYKDQFYTLITLLIFYITYKCTGNIKRSDWLKLGILFAISAITRSGLVLLILAAVLFILYRNNKFVIRKSLILISSILLVGILIYVAYLSRDIIIKKIYAYILESEETKGSTINYFEIKSFSQLYKFPFAYLFFLLQPLNYKFGIKCWMDVAGALNIINIPIALGNIFYLFKSKIKKQDFYWIIQLFYLLTIVTSLGIVRHQYYLQPFMMMFFADFLIKSCNKTLFKLASLFSVMMVLLIWIM